MSMLAKLKPKAGARKKMKRLGRGDASGHGGTSTRGHKGQRARSSMAIRVGFEGGQMPLHRRSPKWGFTNPSQIIYSTVNIGDLSERFNAGDEVNLKSLLEKSLVRTSRRPLKILGTGKLTKALKVTADAFSTSAKKAIEEAKGTVTSLKKTAS
ncbi:MAG: 50S ribosomal protein L15 [Deltaproteobacteria bacterium]|nr:50S ribosomal protein L15 [Deltaproteobacteria bacterium]